MAHLKTPSWQNVGRHFYFAKHNIGEHGLQGASSKENPPVRNCEQGFWSKLVTESDHDVLYTRWQKVEEARASSATLIYLSESL